MALLLRLTALSTAYDIFIDEITYTNIASNIAHGHGVTLYGSPFTLHPPAAFGLYALTIVVFGLHGSTETVLFALRHVDVVLGAAICVMTYLVVERAARPRVALIAALVMAIDPLAISYDSRVMLEAPAQFAVVSMVLCLALAARSSGARWRWLVAAGVAGVLVLWTKETFGLVVVMALLCLVVTGWAVARREALAVVGTVLFGYAALVVAASLTSGFGVWWHAQASGVLRLVGAQQTSGFNAPQTKVSLVSRILANWSTFAATDVVLVAGTLSALGLLWRLQPWRQRTTRDTTAELLWRLEPRIWSEDPRQPTRPNQLLTRDRVTILIAVWTVSAACYLAYATLFGTIEEQMYYITLLPCVISLCIWMAGLVASRSWRWKAAGCVFLGLILIFDASAWVGVHSGHDDEYRRLIAWEAVHVPPRATIATTDGTSQFLLPRGVIGQWNTVAQWQAHHVDFVVIATALVAQGYGLADGSLEQTLEHRGRLVFEANGPSDGSLRVYDVRTMTGSVR
ncbi:MAG TPA: glycosyltransferase family 39 protein [Acidimicrobiales bacterium]|nr:glycosyltransferase family 39 protein [Acidimicrobiales bacterium]